MNMKETLTLGEGRVCKGQLLNICLSYDFFSLKAVGFAEHQKNQPLNLNFSTCLPLIETEVQSKVQSKAE